MSADLNDRFAKLNKFKVLSRSEGLAEVGACPDVTALNGADVVHGGYLFALADYALALASNTDDRLALSASATISYLLPCSIGDPLTARAECIAKTERGGMYDVFIRGKSGKTYAVFHARAAYKPIKRES